MTRGITGVGFPVDAHEQIVPSLTDIKRISDEVQKQTAKYGKKSIRSLVLALDAARNNQEIKLGGTFIWGADGSTNTALIQIRLDNQDNDNIPFRRGSMISGIPFGKFWLTHDAQAGEEITLIIITDSPVDRVDVEN